VRGQLVSVQRNAANLLLEQGPLLALLPAGTPIHPWALTVPLELSTLKQGMGAECDAHVLVLGSLRISLAEAETPDLRVREPLRALPPRWVLESFRRAGPPAEEEGSAPVLAAALDRFCGGADARELAALVGLGGGLTPAGDDTLVGVLAFLGLARAASAAAPALRACLVECVAPTLTGRTSRLSEQMLGAAAEGFYAEPLLNLLRAVAIHDPSPHLIEKEVAALLAVGHRSGADTLRGVAAALDRLMHEASD